MIMIPIVKDERDFAIDWFLEDVARGRMSPADTRDMLAQLRLAGDLAALERLSRAVAEHRAR